LGSTGPPASAAAREPLAPDVIPITRIPRHGQPRIIFGPLAPLDRSSISHGGDDGDGPGGGACELRIPDWKAPSVEEKQQVAFSSILLRAS